jgi:hypothetical protein
MAASSPVDVCMRIILATEGASKGVELGSTFDTRPAHQFYHFYQFWRHITTIGRRKKFSQVASAELLFTLSSKKSSAIEDL